MLGEKIIIVRRYRGEISGFVVEEIVKENKQSWKTNKDNLIYKNLSGIKEKYSPYTFVRKEIFKYSQEKIKELSEELKKIEKEGIRRRLYSNFNKKEIEIIFSDEIFFKIKQEVQNDLV